MSFAAVPRTTGISVRGRQQIAARLLAAESGRVLDVGARDASLGALLDPAHLEYESADLSPGPHTHRVDLEAPLPFADRAYDWVVALDVLEHVDHIHGATSELLRIAGRGCVLSLPNLASWPHRLRFLRSGRLSTTKYELPPEPPPDRHRWLVHLRDADRFVGAAADREGFAIEARVLECEGRGRAGRFAAWSLLGSRLPLASALAARSIYRLVRRIPGAAGDRDKAAPAGRRE
jgi:hypothetical protein